MLGNEHRTCPCGRVGVLLRAVDRLELGVDTRSRSFPLSALSDEGPGVAPWGVCDWSALGDS